ncbi:IS110 family transposase [Mesorhizobium sp. M0187]|uniref:IS110 family transposase n=1 Tax=Mesorhizobium sp. M0187 TaxID=2956908 RepID=UPI00333D2D59
MRPLTTIPGVDAITAATVQALVPDPDGFRSGRHLAAWLGLTPRSHSSGGKKAVGRHLEDGQQHGRHNGATEHTALHSLSDLRRCWI